ncbi:Ig-like domain-containing protein [Methanobrevibacter sp.]|uniref:Ig-like domain-containing protein n=1 Tax=Methanobrevibacter sp. TaxID=66852 RepID=UPI0026DEC3C7|nr:Ig-like domain-containing protein [Methanobrevibacter sp.]MDO5859783.1 Ig-like domain-containing protein [Methanobrevibacter sp.]
MSNKMIILVLILVSFLAISTVSAQDNSTVVENAQDNDLDSQIDIQEITSSENTYSLANTNESAIGDVEDPGAYIYTPSKIYYSYQKDYDAYEYDSNIIYGYNNHFEGYLKIYNGNALIASHFCNGTEDFETGSFFDLIDGKKVSLSKYTLKMEDMDGKVWVSKSLNVVKNPIKLDFTSFKESAEYSSETFYQYVLDEYGNSINDAKGTITLTLNGKQYKTTVKNGKFKLSFNIPVTPKTYVCKVKYSGDAKYQSSSKTFRLTIYKPVPKVYALNKAVKVKSTKIYSVILKNNHGKAMKKAQVSLKVNGKIYYAITNNYGKALFKITNINKKGTVNAFVKYSGSVIYKPAFKTVRFTVV